MALDVGDVTGLSGLTRDGDGTLWAVPERSRALIEIAPDGTTRAIPIEGAPDGLDFEAIAWLGGSREQMRFALGTERDCGDGAYAIAWLTVADGRAAVTGTRPVPLATWGVACADNRGIEGICHVDGQVVIALEQSQDEDGARIAPAARIELATGAIFGFGVALTSDTGKLSGIDCWRAGDAIHAIAIERHFDVSRLIAFTVPAPGAPTPRASVVADLWPLSRQGTRNFEGIVRDSDIYLITDNHWGRITGPSELLRLSIVVAGEAAAVTDPSATRSGTPAR